jgi:hypothetical protein
MATRKLRRYFEAHKVTVLTDQPLNDLFHQQGSLIQNRQMGN